MFKVTRFGLLLCAIALTGCPDSREVISETIEISPSAVAIRDDSEQVTLRKGFEGAAFTTFSEQASGLGISVLASPAQQCPESASSCEDWSFSALTANPGRFEVEAYRDIEQVDLTTTRPSGTARVTAFPLDSGSTSVEMLGSSVFLTSLDSSGRLWSSFDAPLFPEYQLAGADNYTLLYPRQADNGSLPQFSTLVTNDRDYGAALTADGRVFHWGSSILDWPVSLSARPTVYEALEPLVLTRGVNARISAIALPTESLSGDTRTAAISGFAAALVSDGTVIAWDMLQETAGVFAPSAPYFLEGIDTAVALSLKNAYLVALLANGTVVEQGLTSQEGLAPVQVEIPARVGTLQNVVAIAGRRALLADGSVFQWLPTTETASTSTPVRIPGIINAVSLPDPRQNVAILADGSLVGWRYSPGDSAPGEAYPIDLGLIAEVSDVAGDYVVDRACGRVWNASLLRHFTGEPGSFQESPVPVLGFGGASNCDNENLGHVAYIVMGGLGTGTIIPSSGSISCVDEQYGKLCWWFGPVDTQATFTAVPDSSSTFRDWRWDCASGSEVSAPVALRQPSVSNSQSLCKVTFLANAQATPDQRTLSVQVTGDGRVISTPAGIDCGEDCTENYADGTDIMLTASANSGSQFDGWSDGCTQNSSGETVAVSINADITCIANFSSIVSGETPPVARFSVSPESPVTTGSVVTFNSTASSDADGTIVSWEWDFDGDLAVDASGEVVTHTYQNAGTQQVTLAVVDNDGFSSDATAIMEVVTPGLSEPPVASFTVQPDTTQELGSTFVFDASASSDDIGIISWEWDLDNDGVTDSNNEIVGLTPSAVGDYPISLRVTDTDGQTDTQVQQITVTPAPTGATFTLRVVLTGSGRVDIEPGAIMFPNQNCDGDECFLFGVADGTQLTLDAAAFTPAAFSGWSAMECDSIPSPERCIVTMSSDRTVTAAFQ